MALSVVDPVGLAIEEARRVCFRPFDIGKWFTIGFCALLASLVEGGWPSGPNFFNFNNFNLGGPGGGPPREAIDWVQANLILTLMIVLAVLVVLYVLGLPFTWLGSRGQFLFIDNIARNRGAVVAPWREYRDEGNSAFWFRFFFGLAGFAAFLIVISGGILIALADIRTWTFGPAAATGLIIGISGFVVVAIVSGVVNLFLNDFVVPIMYRRRIRVMGAWRVFRDSMLTGHIGTFVLYVLFKIVLSIVVALLEVLLCCFTLCIAAIPYLGTHVLILPLHVFRRSYSLHFMEQFGPEWQFFSMRDESAISPSDEEPEWPNEHFRPADEHIRPADDSIRPPDDRIRPE